MPPGYGPQNQPPPGYPQQPGGQQVPYPTQQQAPIPQIPSNISNKSEGVIRDERKETDSEKDNREFFSQLSESMNRSLAFMSNVKPSKAQYIFTKPDPKKNIHMGVFLREEDSKVYLYIDYGSAVENEKLLTFLEERKEHIEYEFGGKKLNFDHKKEGKRAREIYYEIKIGGRKDKSKWPLIQEKIVEELRLFEKAIMPTLKQFFRAS